MGLSPVSQPRADVITLLSIRELSDKPGVPGAACAIKFAERLAVARERTHIDHHVDSYFLRGSRGGCSGVGARPVASRGAVAAVPVRTQSRSVGFVGSEQGRRGLALSAARARTARGARGFEVVAQAISEVRVGPRPSPRATSRDASAHVFRTRRGGISAKTPKPCSAERGRMPLRTTRSAGRRESARVATERRQPRATIHTPSAPSAPSSALVASRARAPARVSVGRDEIKP